MKEVYITWTADADTLTIFGVYTKKEDAEKGIAKLRSLGIPAVYVIEGVDQPLNIPTEMLEKCND